MSLEQLRNEINERDDELILLLARRNKIVKQIAQYKNEKGIPITQLRREKELIKEKKEKAKELDMDSVFIEKLFRLIIKESKRVQQKCLSARKKN